MKSYKWIAFVFVLMLGLCAAAAADEPAVYTSGDFQYILLEDGTAEITKYIGHTGYTGVPASLNGHKVTSIGNRAFYDSSILVSVSLPDGLTRIGNYAFFSCAQLVSIRIPDTVVSIGHSAFAQCAGLETVHLPEDLVSIGNAAFQSCTHLTSITVPDGTTSIGKKAFYRCKALQSVTLPGSITNIGERAFDQCHKQLVFTVPGQSYALQWCQEQNLDYDKQIGVASITPDTFSRYIWSKIIGARMDEPEDSLKLAAQRVRIAFERVSHSLAD